ncbi:PepSY-associated TM helix domain-containing protein [Tepidamorphus gemmatus]|uniref:PepSY-associated TM helix domain-containing protein n=1 Tax=Tepidamorphus gemmatus TaxID=747076 RepID=UPI0014050F30|nr:PepSY-associated TM helix domain-containing protein [Tepidamorphus gemmatus]
MSKLQSKVWSVLRNWHIWLGVASAIPILIIAVSTVFLVHKSLDFHIPNLLAAGADTGFSAPGNGEIDREISHLEGLLAQAEARPQPGKADKPEKDHREKDRREKDAAAKDRDKRKPKGSMDAKGGHAPDGREPDGRPVTQAEEPEGQSGTVTLPDTGVRTVRVDGFIPTFIATAHADPGEGERKFEKERKDKDKSGVSVRKLMKSLHTGKFLGPLDWLWADLIALSLFFFVLSGVMTWWRSSRRSAGGGTGAA